ncbi:gliding motility protein RemB [Mucilaginibacter limnophilus]|uniref:Gliding motility protein RemB n=2 Tax=Mucilaginibacter limnophilus TaxID=1932778 RepID=A0A3S2XZM1_9SPHI|nr:gliding motility protein RemB [Mucilaginibacter limnophilus]
MLLITGVAYSQTTQLPYQYQFYQKFNADVFSVNNKAHTALKPFFIDSALTPRYDSIMSSAKYPNLKSWFLRKVFNEHVFDVKTDDFTFYGDFMVDLSIGRDIQGKRTTWLNTRGFQAGGTIGKKFSFYTSGYENQGRFAGYLMDYVDSLHIVPGQAYDREPQSQTKDWSYVTAVITYAPIKQLSFTLGQDKHFIGDGYRSLLLSDYASPYPFFRVTADLGPVQYTAIWAQMQDHNAIKTDSHSGLHTNNRRKWTAIHYIDWNITSRASLGFFNAYVVPESDDNGTRRGFDANFINPIFFASSIGSSKQPGNSIAGFNAKYKFLDKHAVYAQLLLDKVQGLEGGGSRTTKGYQAGVRGADIFGVRNLNYLFEYNTVDPYAYTGAERLSSYSSYAEPLAHPYGANFKEMLGILNYSIGKFDFQGKMIYAKYGIDVTATDNYGKNVTRPYNSTTAAGTSVGQGFDTSLKFAEGTISYIVNPRYNLRVEAGAIVRQQTNDAGTVNTTWLTFGVRTSFRNLYNDF